MSWWHRFLNFLLPTRRRAIEADVQQELNALRELAGEDDRNDLGNLTRATEDARAEWSWPLLELIARDLRMAVRTLRKNPGYVSACVLILALGIGANTAIFSIVDAVVLRPLPYPNIDRLVFLWESIPSLPEPIGPRMQVQKIVYEEWKRQSDIFADMAAFQETPLNERGVERPRTISSLYVSANFLPLLGARAEAGRLIQGEDDQKGSDHVVVLSDSYFEKRFHRDPAAIGKSITLGNSDYTIIGVLAQGFHVPALYGGEDQKRPEVWLPLSRLWDRSDYMAFQLYVVGLLQPGVALNQARTAIAGVQTQLLKANPDVVADRINIFPFSVEDKSDDTTLALYVLLGSVGFLLLIGCANLANLTMARATRRAREISVRRALGASRTRIVGQLLTEAFLVSIAGTIAGVALSQILLTTVLKANLPVLRPEEVELNWPVFAFAAAISVLTTLLFGLAPAISASRISVNEVLKSRGGGASAALGRSRQVLTTIEVGLAVILLCGAGLSLRSFAKLVTTGVGFKTERLTVADIELPELRYPEPADRRRFYDKLADRARLIPGIEKVAESTTLPMKGINFSTFAFPGVPKPKVNDAPSSASARVSLDYFQLMELPILSGRDFTRGDLARNVSPKGDGVTIINQAFASKYFHDQNPLGKRILLEDDRPYEIVGVAQNFLAMGAASEPDPQFFELGIDMPKGLLLVRSKVPLETISDEIRATILDLDAEMPVAQVNSMDHIIYENLADSRSLVVLLGSFAGLALVLAMIGVYSVLASLVAVRTREIGIRMALGAKPADVGRMVAGQSLKPLLIGVVLGVCGGLALSRLITSLLVGVSPNDPLTFGLAVASVVLVAPLAVWGPVRRATRVECTVALREE